MKGSQLEALLLVALLFVADVNPKVIQELLGHSKMSMTLEVYSHVLPSMQQEAAGKMDEVFKKL